MRIKVADGGYKDDFMHINPMHIVSAYRLDGTAYFDTANRETYEVDDEDYGSIVAWIDTIERIASGEGMMSSC